jgi:hypothetical protein
MFDKLPAYAYIKTILQNFLLKYSLGDHRVPEASSCKYLGIIIRSDLSWADQVNYTVQKA